MIQVFVRHLARPSKLKLNRPKTLVLTSRKRFLSPLLISKKNPWNPTSKSSPSQVCHFPVSDCLTCLGKILEDPAVLVEYNIQQDSIISFPSSPCQRTSWILMLANTANTKPLNPWSSHVVIHVVSFVSPVMLHFVLLMVAIPPSLVSHEIPYLQLGFLSISWWKSRNSTSPHHPKTMPNLCLRKSPPNTGDILVWIMLKSLRNSFFLRCLLDCRTLMVQHPRPCEISPSWNFNFVLLLMPETQNPRGFILLPRKNLHLSEMSVGRPPVPSNQIRCWLSKRKKHRASRNSLHLPEPGRFWKTRSSNE